MGDADPTPENPRVIRRPISGSPRPGARGGEQARGIVPPRPTAR